MHPTNPDIRILMWRGSIVQSELGTGLAGPVTQNPVNLFNQISGIDRVVILTPRGFVKIFGRNTQTIRCAHGVTEKVTARPRRRAIPCPATLEPPVRRSEKFFHTCMIKYSIDKNRLNVYTLENLLSAVCRMAVSVLK